MHVTVHPSMAMRVVAMRALALVLALGPAWSGLARAESPHPELQALPTAAQVKPLSLAEAKTVPLLRVGAADILRKVRATCFDQVFGIYVRGRGSDRQEVEEGQSLFTCRLGQHGGQPSVLFAGWTLVPGRDWIRTRSRYRLTGRLPLVHRQLERARGKRWQRREHLSFGRQKNGWEIKNERAPQAPARRITGFEPALTQNSLTLSTLLYQGKVKPGDRFRYRWLDLRQNRPLHSAVQILAVKNGQARDRSQALYKLEELVVQWGHRSTHLVDGTTRVRFIDYGDYWLRPITGKRADRIRARLQAYSPRTHRRTFWERHGFTLILLLIIGLALGSALALFLVARPRRRA